MTITRLVGVYRADGGLRGELRYLAGHYLRGQSCSLCDITHSPFRRKAAWDAAVADLGIPITLVHLNEMSADLAGFVGDRAACVVAETTDGWTMVLGNQDLETLHGDVPAFFSELRQRLASAGLDLPAPRAT